MASPWENDAIVSTSKQPSPWETDIFAKAPPADAKLGQYGLMWNETGGYDPKTGELVMGGKPMTENEQTSKIVSGAAGVADAGMLGFADEAIAGLRSLMGGGSYDDELNYTRQGLDKFKNDNPGSYFTGQVAGGIDGAAMLGAGGLSLGANAINAGSGLGKVAAMSAADGAILGGAQGFGSGEGGFLNRGQNALLGGALGGALGAAAPVAVTAASKAISPVLSPIMARVNPDKFAQDYLTKTVLRSGMSGDDITNSMRAAGADGQGDIYTLADALGNAGQRALSTAARNPHDQRQALVEALMSRQAGQGDRLSSFLAEGFGAPDTAAQREAALTATRKATADTAYEAARQNAKPVNLNGTLETIDGLLRRDPILGETALSQGPMGQRLMALRDRLQKGGEQLVDFDTILNIKSDLYNQMQRNPNVRGDLAPAYSALDKALEGASDGYRAANDGFRAASKEIDAVDVGRNAYSGRVRSQDTIPQFNAMKEGEQSAFRAGYVDPYIAKIESSAMSPTTNKARNLITPKTGAEFPAFAVPGKADQLGNRIARENQMFQTSNAALGGSKTADNLADAADMNGYDPSVMSRMFKGDVPGALVEGFKSLISAGKGETPKVIERLAKALMTTNPDEAQALISGGLLEHGKSQAAKARLISALVSSGAVGSGRIASP